MPDVRRSPTGGSTSQLPPTPAPDDVRLRRLERRVRYLIVIFGAYVALTVFVYFHDWRAGRHVLSTSTLFTSEVQIPHPNEWPGLAVSGGIAPAQDGNSIGLWLASGVLQALQDGQLRHQIRMELDRAGNERLLLIDRAGTQRLRIALATDGSPSIELLDAKGRITWTTTSPVP